MSRIGKMPIAIPAGVNVAIEGAHISVKGPKGQLERDFNPEITVAVDNGQIVVTRPSDEKNHRALHGLTRTLIANMIQGVTNGFEKSLDLVGVGYRAAKQGKTLVLTIGYSHPVEIVPEAGLEIEVPTPNKIIVKGADKEKVGQLAANIRFIRPPEPYKGKGIKYTEERIRMKVGKAGTKKK
ncbi:MAG: 50S ribosomal protein L6 [Peptococcia bacterium]|jgi:large subunit ribosomal protein L6